MNPTEDVFCGTCNSPRKIYTDKVCRECGTKYQIEDSPLAFTKSEPSTGPNYIQAQQDSERAARTKGKNFSFKWLLILLLALCLSGGSIAGYLYAKSKSSPEQFAKEVAVILKNSDIDELKLVLSDYGMNKLALHKSAESLLESLSNDGEAQEKVIQSLLKQGRSLEEGTKIEPFVLEIQPSNKRRWFLFTQYEVVFKPIDIALRVPEGTKLEVDGNEVTPSEKGVATIQLPVAGLHHILVKNNEGEEEWKLYIWGSSKEEVVQFEDDMNTKIAMFADTKDDETVTASANDNSSNNGSSTNNESANNKNGSTTTAPTHSGSSFSDSEVEGIVLKIREEYNYINNNQNSYKRSTYYVEDDGEIRYTKYKDANDIMRKMVVELTFINGTKKITEYYFWGSGDFFFSFSTFEGAENRYYFHSNRMIRWIDSEKTLINFEAGQNDSSYLSEESAVLDKVGYVYEVVNKF